MDLGLIIKLVNCAVGGNIDRNLGGQLIEIFGLETASTAGGMDIAIIGFIKNVMVKS
ncbi:MAG TPA: hypothetical protein VLM20_00130 [Methylophilaceae bacterium]|nr:hypothetical protein [Methylophilaceae bacterium]